MAEGKKPVSDDGISHANATVAPAGGKAKDKKADAGESKVKLDLKTPGNTAVKEDSEVEDQVVIEVAEGMETIFEGMDLSEDFKDKISVVFEAAVSENVALKVKYIQESLTIELEEQLEEAVSEKMTSIIENVDSYLDYVVNEWMVENELAIESGVKVSMAESLMSGLTDLFAEHNIDIDDTKVDVVFGLEEELSNLEDNSNKIVNENIRLNQQIAALNAEKVFAEVTEGLTVSQRERMKTLSENLDVVDQERYVSSLNTIKESFFGEKGTAPKAQEIEETAIITEDEEIRKPASDYGSINALVESFNKRTEK
jgi:hypothetical protein